jgi:hypothetical protein
LNISIQDIAFMEKTAPSLYEHVVTLKVGATLSLKIKGTLKFGQ